MLENISYSLNITSLYKTVSKYPAKPCMIVSDEISNRYSPYLSLSMGPAKSYFPNKYASMSAYSLRRDNSKLI